MSELVVVGFKDAEEADRVLLRLAKLKKEHLIDLEDAVVVIRDEAGRAHLKQSINPTINGATTGFMLASDSLWGGLIGLLFMHPIPSTHRRFSFSCARRNRKRFWQNSPTLKAKSCERPCLPSRRKNSRKPWQIRHLPLTT